MKQWDDATTGAALRRLVEACDTAETYRAWIVLEWTWPRAHSGEGWEARVEKHIGDGTTRFRGSTPAEALDKARRMVEG